MHGVGGSSRGQLYNDVCLLAHPPLPESNCHVRRLPWRGLVTGGMWGRYFSEQRRHLWDIICGSRATRNAELDIKWSGGLGTTAVVAPAVQRPPLQLIYIKYIKLSVARQPYVLSYIGLKSNRKSSTLYRKVALHMTLSAPEPSQTTPFSAFCTAIHSFVTGEPRDFKFGTLIASPSPTLPMKNLPWPVLEFFHPM